MGVLSFSMIKVFNFSFCSHISILLLYTHRLHNMTNETYNNLQKRTGVLEKMLIEKENTKNINITNTYYDLYLNYTMQSWNNLLIIIYMLILFVIIYLFVYVQLDMKLYKKVLIVLVFSIIPFLFQIYDKIVYYIE